MFDVHVLSIQFSREWRLVRNTFRRWWRTIPYTTTDRKERAWRKRVFYESLRHEWKFVVHSSWFDWMVPEVNRRRRESSRISWKLNHHHRPLRHIADAYVSHVGISSGR